MDNNVVHVSSRISRRKFLSAAAAGLLFPACLNGKIQSLKVPVCIFSKHLQWLDYQGMAETAAETGFDGIALTVRPGGHVLPERVEEDLPRAVDAVRSSGLNVPIMVSGISDAWASTTVPILKTASALGIHRYRLGYWRYDETTDVLDRLAAVKPHVEKIAALNRRYRIWGGLQNHTRNYFGSVSWDAWTLMKDLDPEWIGFQFDPENAFWEGTRGSWRTGARLVLPRTGMLVVKTEAEWSDPTWHESTVKEQQNWKVLTRENWIWYLRILNASGFSGPVSVHFEFPLGGANQGKRKLDGITKRELLMIMKRNLGVLREMLAEAGF